MRTWETPLSTLSKVQLLSALWRFSFFHNAFEDAIAELIDWKRNNQ
jgi:hypothetical protein